MTEVILYIYIGSTVSAIIVNTFEHFNSYNNKFPLWMELLGCFIPVLNTLFLCCVAVESIKMLMRRQ